MIATKSRDGRTGFTLAEALIASVVLAATVISISVALNSGQMQASASSYETQAYSLAEELMERVLGLPYNDPNGKTTVGPYSWQTTPQMYTFMAGYVGYSEAAGGIKDANGNLMPSSYQTFNRSVSGQFTNQAAGALGASVAGLQVTVTVTDKYGRAYSISRFAAAAAHPAPY